MSNRIKKFSEFNNVSEGGAAIKSSKDIKESEVPATLQHIRENILPLIGVGEQEGEDYMFIGSIGKKMNPDDTSGDVDLTYDGEKFAEMNGVDFKACSATLMEILKEKIPAVLGFEPEMKLMQGLGILSVGWPIKGDIENGVVQLDLIPVKTMDWARFIYYSPDYRTGESKWKSAHRNWLLSAALVAKKEILSRDEQGEVMDYLSPVIVLPSGLYLNKKSYQGKIKSRLKDPKRIDQTFITNNPQELIDYALGPGYTENDVKTFEQVFKIMTSQSFKYKDFLPEIKEKFIELLNRTNLPIPPETEKLS
jgi:hypothetical protein